MNKRPWNDGGAETRSVGGGRKPQNPRPDLGAPFWVAKSQNKREQIHQQNTLKNEHPETRTLMPKGCQREDTIDAKTHPKTMPEYLSKQIMEIMKIISLICKTIQMHLKTHIFEGLTGCARERKRYQNNIKHETNILPNIDKQTMRKRCSKK